MFLPDLYRPSLERPKGIADNILRTRLQQLYQWGSLAFSLCQDYQNLESIEECLLLYNEVVLNLRASPPFGLVMDLMNVLRDGERFTSQEIVKGSLGADILLRYRNEVLYPLGRMPMLLKAQQYWKRLQGRSLVEGEICKEAHSQFKALAYLIAQMLSSVSDLWISPFRPSKLRKNTDEEPDSTALLYIENPCQAVVEFEEGISYPGWFSEYYQLLIERFTKVSREGLIHLEQIHVLEHFEHLGTHLDRLRWQGMSRVFEQIKAVSQQIKFFKIRDEGYRRVLLPTKGTASEGGICGLTTNGIIENLVPSELLYWEKSNVSEGDAFILRWLQGDLLFYLREPSSSFTYERKLVVGLQLHPAEAYYKGEQGLSQGLAVVIGLLTRLIKELREICPVETLELQIILGPEQIWIEESALIKLFIESQTSLGGNFSWKLSPSVSREIIETPKQHGECRVLFSTSSLYNPKWRATKPDFFSVLVSPQKYIFTGKTKLLPTEATSLQEIPNTDFYEYFLSLSSPQIEKHLCCLRDVLLEWILWCGKPPIQVFSSNVVTPKTTFCEI